MSTLAVAPACHISPDNELVKVEIFIAAPRDRVFEALTDPRQSAQWWGRKDEYYFNQFNMDVRVGGKWSTSGKSAKSGDLEVHGEFLEVDPPRRLAYSWISSWLPKLTNVLWELESQAKGTLVKLTHTGFAGNAEATKAHSHGWSLVFTWLQAYAEKGETANTGR
ncbi:MAG TPA: SRPBCC domain-containing protein [Terriglobales bacterium]|nr:SRPBCC domain-containing protein [Terriglobales bacterium]